MQFIEFRKKLITHLKKEGIEYNKAYYTNTKRTIRIKLWSIGTKNVDKAIGILERILPKESFSIVTSNTFHYAYSSVVIYIRKNGKDLIDMEKELYYV